ncbi:oxidoreductase [Ulvibacterium marinum]|uniref:SDR family NAD(P)-dependent oxidoreductase n=1 Tax=Ulvibacterium marinum TaxID=2419782 RepID=A0A3B0CDU9_9FLAO|nr:oxidoreductase [Ulvibacterium marinum]RKN83530.1 SDR family NAD(P)-dependent oxidoreductase [Ulvibacterium marinum]
MSTQKVWFVTGASKGLGLSLVKKLLDAGHRVAATSRTPEAISEKIDAPDTECLVLSMDLTNDKDIRSAIDATEKHFGTIDYVVNNAGYALMGALEESSSEEIKKNFDVNVNGSLDVIRNVLPLLREKGSGHIINIASVGGFVGSFPAFGIYCATKFAVQGFTESLAVEVEPFGIRATSVNPGYFRTEFLSNESLNATKIQLPEYENVREMQKLHEEKLHGNQPGDPDKAAEVLMELVAMEKPPVHLFLGSDAYDMVDRKIDSLKTSMEEYRELATSTNIAESV